MPRGRRTGRIPTSGSSSSGTASSGSRSRRSSTSAFPTRRKGGSRSSGATSSRGRAAPSSAGASSLGKRLLEHGGSEGDRTSSAPLGQPQRPRRAREAASERSTSSTASSRSAGPIVPRSPTGSSTRSRARRLQDRAPGGARAARKTVSYSVLEVEGPPHRPHVHLRGRHRRGTARSRDGASKKAAEQAPPAGAREARRRLGRQALDLGSAADEDFARRAPAERGRGRRLRRLRRDQAATAAGSSTGPR
jgi:hypothetical protein